MTLNFATRVNTVGCIHVTKKESLGAHYSETFEFAEPLAGYSGHFARKFAMYKEATYLSPLT